VANDQLGQRYRISYDKRAKDKQEEYGDISRKSRIPFYRKFCIPAYPNLAILDLGAADGVTLKEFEENGVGCDIAKEYCQRMKKNSLQSVCCAVEYLPFRKGQFSFVVASAILEHVIDLKRCVNEIGCIMNQGNLLLVNVPYKEDLTPYNKCKYEYSHLRSFDEITLIRLLEKFNVENIFYHDFTFAYATVTSPRVNRLLSDIYCAIPKNLRWVLLSRKWTGWVKPFSLTLLLRKKGT
jgi:hypothetical protein